MQLNINEANNRKISIIEVTSYLTLLFLLLSIYSFPDKPILTYISSLLFLLVIGGHCIKRFRITSYIMWGFLFIAMCLLSIFWAENQITALETSIHVIQTIVICSLLSIWINSSKKTHTLIYMIIFCTLILGFRILMEVPFSDLGSRRDAYILGVNVNTFAIRFTLSAILSMYIISLNKGKRKLLFIIFFVLLVFFVLLMGSRRSLFILTFSILLFTFMSSKNLVKTAKSILMSLIIVVIIFYLTLNVQELYVIIGSRIESMTYSFLNGNQVLDESRSTLIKKGWELFQQKPVLGWGIGNYSIASGMGRYSHNNYIEVLSSIGLVGIFLFYILHLSILIRTFKNVFKFKINAILFTILVAILISDFAAPSYSSLFIHVFLVIIISYQDTISRKRKRGNLFEKQSGVSDFSSPTK